MIVLKWFKRLFERFQQADDDDDEQLSYMDYTNEKNEMEGTYKPNFRFPIITDAEIYGWDEELPEKKEKPNRDAHPREKEFEPIPFYMNERWPREKKSGTIHRVGDAKKNPLVSTQIEQPIQQEELAFPQQAKRESSIAKRSTRPFSPTNVPSPVFGFAPPPVQKERLPNEDAILEVVEERTVHSMQNDHDHSVNPRKQEEQHPAISIEETVDQKEPTLSTDRSEELELIEEDLQQEQQQEQQQDQQQDLTEDCPDIEMGEQAFQADAAQEEIDTSPHTMITTAAEKERIVPFNVLMLKSDKEKVIIPTKLPQEDMKIVHEQQPSVSEEDEVLEQKDEEIFPHYAFPSIDNLLPPEQKTEDTDWLQMQSEKLEEALSYFSIQANVIDAVQGPTVTRFELTVGHGTKVSKIRNLTDDLKLALAAEEIRIQAPIPGRSSIGIEIPNRVTRPVRISEVIRSEQFQRSASPMEAVLGLDLTGKPETIDLRKMPHGMIAGATGSGKSVCINSILVSLLYKASPADVKMMLIDPKMVELAPFNGIPHLISPVITDVKAANAALKWAVEEMERRYELLAHAGVRDIERYNQLIMKEQRYSLKMPYLLIVIDELADLMMMAAADVEVSISRIAQKARACGIHLIIATQRPSVDVITGMIKANIPTRIAFSVSSQIDSRTILDTPGAERLLGRGDMLYIGNGQSAPSRLQGTFVTDEEMERIIEHVQREAKPVYLFGQEDLLASAIEEEESDPLFDEVCKFIVEQGSASTSLLQRHFSIGYNRAAKLIDRMEEKGFISGQRGSKPRDVYLTESDLETLSSRID